MIVDIITQVDFEDGANIDAWAADNGHQVRYHHMYRSDRLPAVDTVEFAAIMGGPMGVNDQTQYPYLLTEKRFIKDMLNSGKPMLGICLGAQLIASVLGAKVEKNRYREIGWDKVNLTKSGKESLMSVLPEEFIAFHLHGDTFSIPQSAAKLACSRACDNQAFSYGDNVLGLQFHLEYSRRSVELIVENCADELSLTGPYIQSREDIFSGIDQYADDNKKFLYKLLDKITQSKRR